MSKDKELIMPPDDVIEEIVDSACPYDGDSLGYYSLRRAFSEQKFQDWLEGILLAARVAEDATILARVKALETGVGKIAGKKLMKELSSLPCPTTFSLEACMGRHDAIVLEARALLTQGDTP